MAESAGGVQHAYASSRYRGSDNFGVKYTNKYACTSVFLLKKFLISMTNRLYISYILFKNLNHEQFFLDNSTSKWINYVSIKRRRCMWGWGVRGLSPVPIFFQNRLLSEILFVGGGGSFKLIVKFNNLKKPKI